MKKRVFIAAIMIFMLAGATMAGEFAADRPWLAERSTWSETTGPQGGFPGWWAVGNSRVFGIVGTGNPITTIHQITGPHIMLAGVMNNGSAFGPSTINITVGGAPAKFTKQTLSKVRGTDIVVMDLIGEGIEVNVYNYAPFDVNAMLRTIVIKNTGQNPLNDVTILANVNRTIVKDGFLFDSFQGATGGSAMGQTRQLFSNFVEPAEVASNEQKAGLLTVKVGAIPAGTEAIRTQFLAFSMVEVNDQAATIDLVKRENVNLLKKTYDDWRGWLAATTNLKCADQRLIDLIDDTKILVKIQTADPQGAVGPMEFFAGVWVRDSMGPFLYYLRMGNIEAARKMLEFYYRGSAYNKNIANWIPMDIDISKPVDPNMDWTQVTNDPVEIPSWIILQHKRYYDYTGDITPIKEHWGYLKKCLIGQLTNDKGEPTHTANFGSKELGPNYLYRFPHHGDETWIYPGFEVLNSAVFPEPNDHPHWDEFSTDSTWEFVVSAETMSEFAKKIGDAADIPVFEAIARDSRAALERDYWMPEKGLYAPAMDMRSYDVHQPPFTMVNFNALWIHYLEPEDPKAISNVLETMKYTMNPNFVTDATETLRIYVGMQPGMFLYNLKAIDHPYAEQALKAMVEVASPTGEYTEKHITEPTSYKSGFLGHRIRPWEGGINMDAAFYYLTGLIPDLGDGKITLCPNMPEDWKEMSVTGQKIGDGQLSIGMTDDGAKRTYTLALTGSKPVVADFKISLPQSKISSVKIGDKAVAIKPVSKWGRTRAKFEMPLTPGQTAIVTVDYAKEKVEPLKFVRQKFQYVVPKNVPAYDLIFWQCDPRKGNEKDFRTFDYMKQKNVNYRLITSFIPSSPEWLRPFLMKDGKINTPVFYMGKGSVTNSLKYAKWWGNPELTKLFKQYMEAGGAIVMLQTGETTSDHFGALLGDSKYYTVPMEAAAAIPTEGVGTKVFELLGIQGTPEKKLLAPTMYIYSNMVVLARPETEKTSAVVVAKKYGKGFLLTLNINLDYEQAAIIGKNLADPKKVAEIAQIIGSAKPESVEGAFKDFSKDNSYADDFGSYQNGSAGLPVWLPLYGTWKMQDGEYHMMLTNGYDFHSTANARIVGDYEAEVKIKAVEGIQEGGFIFNLPSRFSKGSGEMVRFCGHEALWCGPFNSGGGFSLEHDIKTGLTTRDDVFHTLKIAVHNSKAVYDIFVDGKKVGENFKITNVAPKEGAYLALVACRGHVAFDDLKISPIK